MNTYFKLHEIISIAHIAQYMQPPLYIQNARKFVRFFIFHKTKTIYKKLTQMLLLSISFRYNHLVSFPKGAAFIFTAIIGIYLSQ